MVTLTEGAHATEFIASEANGARSRDEVTIVSGQNLEAGAVVGRVTANGKYAAYNNGASDGTETAAGILLSAVDASSADAQGAILARDAEVNSAELGWNTQDQAAQDAGVVDLAAIGIIVRTAL